MENRFAIRPDPGGFSVYDQTTGETLVIATARQSGLSRKDAEHTAAVFNQSSEPQASTTH